MDISSAKSARDQINSKIDKVLTKAALEAVDKDPLSEGPSQPAGGGNDHDANDQAAIDAVPPRLGQPLAVTRKLLIDKINEVFEVHERVVPMPVAGDELSAEQAAADVVRSLGLAFRTFKTRFKGVADDDIMHRFQALASQIISDGLLEARAHMAKLELYESGAAVLLNQIDDRINLGLASLAKR